ncbi:hypothetical protein MZM54_03875 [[Brevibacterium] frigoritolerans]|nr:hypothetical protein [Peribacillus frigoritolerans]
MYAKSIYIIKGCKSKLLEVSELKNDLETFFNDYGIQARRKLNYDRIYMRFQTGFFDTTSDNGRIAILHRFIDYHSGGLYISDYEKYFTSPVPAHLEEKYKQLIEKVIIKANKQKNVLTTGILINNFSICDFDEVLNYLSPSWEVQKIFVDKKDMVGMAATLAIQYFKEFTAPVKEAIKNELPEIILKHRRDTKSIFIR